MNYLAHFYLSDQSDEGFVGSLLGDFVRGRFTGKFTPTIEREIEIHRKVDAFTDSNFTVKQSKQRVYEIRRRYAGVLIDVFYDHFFALDFEQYSNQSLKIFSAEIYRALRESRKYLPVELYARIAWIAECDLLNSYTKIEGIERALFGISRRLKRENSLSEGIFDLEKNYGELRSDFEKFFPEVIRFVQNERNR